MRRKRPSGALPLRSGWSVPSALQQRTADGHGESMAGKERGRSLPSNASWLRKAPRRRS